MRLWTIQDQAVVDELDRTGRFRASWDKIIHDDFDEAYRWLMGKVGYKHPPVWLWPGSIDVDRVFNHDKASIILVCEIPFERVTLTNFAQWHSVLNRSFLAHDEAEWDSMDDVDPEALVRSWDRLLDEEFSGNDDWWGEPEFQATVQSIEPGDVVAQFTIDWVRDPDGTIPDAIEALP